MKNRSQKSGVRSQEKAFILNSVFWILTSDQDQEVFS